MFARSLSCLCLVHAILPNSLAASLEGVSFKTVQGRQLLRGDITAQLSGAQDIGDEQQQRHARILQAAASTTTAERTQEKEDCHEPPCSPDSLYGLYIVIFGLMAFVFAAALLSPCIIFLIIVVLAGVIGGSIFLCITCCKRKRQREKTAPVRSNNWYWGV